VPKCGSTALAVDPDDHWRRICEDCGAVSRFQHMLFVPVGDEHFPLPAPQAEEVAADLLTEPSPDAKTAAEKIKNAVGAEAESSTAFNDAELHQIGLALTRLQVSDAISQLGANLQAAILRHTLR
jgi:hypothetical protein